MSAPWPKTELVIRPIAPVVPDPSEAFRNLDAYDIAISSRPSYDAPKKQVHVPFYSRRRRKR